MFKQIKAESHPARSLGLDFARPLPIFVTMAKIDHISIKGFKSIESVERLRLGDLNVLIGANGAGKSNFIGAFDFLAHIRQGGLARYVAKAGGAGKVLHFGSKRTRKIAFKLSFKGGVNGYNLSLDHATADTLVPVDEEASFRGSGHDNPIFYPLSGGTEAGISDAKNHRGAVRYVADHLTSWRRFHFHDTSPTSTMKAVAKLQDNRFLRRDGGNLAAFLYWMKSNAPREFALINKTVQRVIPFFDSFQLEPLADNPDGILLEWRHKASDQYFNADDLSDGSLRFIALATLFLQPKAVRPSIIIIDEPELGLHPFAITLLASLMKQVSVETQVLVATQSSLLLDHLEPEDIIVADQVKGASTFTRFADSEIQKLEKWLEDYSLGQLWEKNEFSGRPQAF